jgi:amino-acid N-acetyltransferase
MKKQLHFSFAGISDFETVLNILGRCELPNNDLDPGKMISFILAKEDNNTIACIGLETYGEDGLLRSLAVDNNYRRFGIGSTLTDRLIAFAIQRGVKKLHLLTNTAETFFAKKGFHKTDRSLAPSKISQSSEFSYLCPSSAVYMVLENLAGRAVYYQSGLQVINAEPATHSAYWEISGEQMRFTYFEVPPNALFEKHAHEIEQITYVIEGELFFSADGKAWCLKPGDSIVVPAGIVHAVWTEDKPAKAVDAWSRLPKII